MDPAAGAAEPGTVALRQLLRGSASTSGGARLAPARVLPRLAQWHYTTSSAALPPSRAAPAWPVALYTCVTYGAVFGLISMGAVLAVTYSAVFGLLSFGDVLAVAAPAMLDSRPVRLIP